MKKKNKLTKRQSSALKRHSSHHTSAHMSMMKKLMIRGESFTSAHKKAMKKAGK